jgi:phenylalanyl-tRNA synthetase beta chain
LRQPTYTGLSSEPLLHPGRAAVVAATRPDDEALALSGVVGELNPAVGNAVDLRGARLIVAELDLAGLAGGAPKDRPVDPPPRHPASERDIAIVVPDASQAGAVEAAIRGAAGPDLVDLLLFDIYRGAPLGDAEKSLAWRLVFRSTERTLTDAEIDASVAAITRAVAAIGGRIRT